MKNLDRNLRHPHETDEGWFVHIYGSNRRLLCTIDPSHGWSMAVGLVLGVVLTLGLIERPPSTAQVAPSIDPAPAPLAVD